MEMEKKRPTIITILCALMVLGVIIDLVITPLVFMGMEMWHQVLAVTALLVSIVTISGLWKMKKWVVILYTVSNIVVNIVLWMAGIWIVEAAFWPAVVMAIMFSQYSKMN